MPSSVITTDFDLPEHVNVLFLQTVEDSDLSDEIVRGLKLLLRDHQETFASFLADLGFCSLIKHDINTGDARPIKQSPRRPPLAARDAHTHHTWHRGSRRLPPRLPLRFPHYFQLILMITLFYILRSLSNSCSS